MPRKTFQACFGSRLKSQIQILQCGISGSGGWKQKSAIRDLLLECFGMCSHFLFSYRQQFFPIGRHVDGIMSPIFGGQARCFMKLPNISLAGKYEIMREVVKLRLQDRQVSYFGLECTAYFILQFTMINSFLVLGNQTMQIFPSISSSKHTYGTTKIQVLHV